MPIVYDWTHTVPWNQDDKEWSKQLRHQLFGADVDATNQNPRFKYPVRLQPVASNTVTLLTIDEDYNGVALAVDTEATTVNGVDIAATVMTTGTALDIGDLDALTSGIGVNVVSNSADTGAFTLVYVKNDSVTATGASLMTAVNDSTGTSITIDHNGATGKSLYIDAESTTQTAGVVDIAATVLTTGTAIDIGDLDALTSGIGINVVSNSADTGAFTLVYLKNDSVTATGASLLTAVNDSTGSSITIDHNGATGKSLYIDAESTTQTAGVVDIAATVLTTGTAIDIGDLDALTSGIGINVVSNSADTGAFTLIYLKNDSVTATGASLLTAVNDSTGSSITIDHNGATGKSLYIDAESTTQTAGVVDIAATVLTTGTAIDIGDLDALTSGKGINVVSNSTDTGEFRLVYLKNDSVTATGASLLEMINDSTGTELLIQSTAGGTAGVDIQLYHNSATPANDDVLSNINTWGEDNEGTQVEYGRIQCLITSVISAAHSSRYIVYTSTSGAVNEAFRILDTGKIQVDLASDISTSGADVFDEYKDLDIIGKWRKNPALRGEFVNDLVGMGVAERKTTGSGVMLSVQDAFKLSWGAFNQVGGIIHGLEDRLARLERGIRPELIVDMG